MEKDFWIERWKEGKIGFHQETVHPKLTEFSDHLKINQESKVLLPLCGKTQDLLWFEQHAGPTLGVEISERALGDFCRENSRDDLTEIDILEGRVFQSEKLSLVCADFFNLPSVIQKSKELEDFQNGFDVIYDRASNVALPPEMRKKYYDVIKRLLKPNGEIFLVSFSYNQDHMQGPPFSVPESEIQEAYSEFSIEKIDAKTEKLSEGRFYEAGLRELTEEVFLIKAKNS